MNVEVESRMATSAWGHTYPVGKLVLKDETGTVVHTQPTSGNPVYKFFNRQGVTWVYLGSDFSADMTFVNTSTQEIHRLSYNKHPPLFSDIFPSPEGHWIAGVEHGEIYFYALDEPAELRFIMTDDADYMNDDFLLTVDGNESFSWLDANHFVFERNSVERKFKVVFEFLEDGQILLPVKEISSIQS